jgi:mannose-6-phosphate isomerase-like protein (cupin superfamily)
MSAYTIKNLMDIEDSASGRAPGVEARFGRSHIDSEDIGVTYMRYGPDVRSPMGHSHREQEEVYVVLSGSGRVKLGDDVRELQRWDVVRVAPSTIRAFEAGPEGLELLAIGSTRPEGGDGVPSPEGWWLTDPA